MSPMPQLHTRHVLDSGRLVDRRGVRIGCNLDAPSQVCDLTGVLSS